MLLASGGDVLWSHDVSEWMIRNLLFNLEWLVGKVRA